jgi:glycosyltransferase involved in cell wall biosynthesis
MPPITALLHTTNDALRLGRALETLLPCAEIIIVDHHSADATRRIARDYGARIVTADS